MDFFIIWIIFVTLILYINNRAKKNGTYKGNKNINSKDNSRAYINNEYLGYYVD